MPLNAQSPIYLHYFQNISLIILCLTFVPLISTIAIISALISPFTHITRHIKLRRKWRATSSPAFRPRTILITGVGMSKGLALARDFYAAGHTVIGADFEPYYIPVSGRFSRSLHRFFRLTKSSFSSRASSEAEIKTKISVVYINSILSIIRTQNVELWVSCSGVGSAVEDGQVAEHIVRETRCKVVQFGAKLTSTLHEKYSFIEHTRNLGLNVPQTHRVTNTVEALSILFPPDHTKEGNSSTSKKYIMKPVGMDDAVRADMTLLPLSNSTAIETTDYMNRNLRPTPTRPFVIQQFITGVEYCTHALVIRGKVHVFVACRSSDMQMHYSSLPSSCALSQAIFRYSTLYTWRTQNALGKDSLSVTGHFSLDFLVDRDLALMGEEKIGATDEEINELMKKLYPIECNPRAHTAVVLMGGAAVKEDMVSRYISLLDVDSEGNAVTEEATSSPVVPSPHAKTFYWVGNDLVVLVVLPLLQFLRFEKTARELIGEWLAFVGHVLFWKDGMYEIWDPWPWWALYVVYLPCMFMVSILEGSWWSRCNISTGKFFRV